MHTPRGDDIVIMGEYEGVFRIGMLGDITVTSWFSKLDKRSAVELARVTTLVIDRLQGERGSSVHLTDSRVQLPDADAREALLQLLRDTAARTACVSVVVDGGGFWASAVRSFITGLSVLAPSSVDMHAHASIAQVVEWLPPQHLQRTGVSIDPQQLQRLLVTGRSWQDEVGRPPRR